MPRRIVGAVLALERGCAPYKGTYDPGTGELVLDADDEAPRIRAEHNRGTLTVTGIGANGR